MPRVPITSSVLFFGRSSRANACWSGADDAYVPSHARHRAPVCGLRGASCRKSTRKGNATRPIGRSRRRAFILKGSHQLDWGMKNRLARVFCAGKRPYRHAGDRPRLLSRPDHRARAHRSFHPAAVAVLRRAVLHARHFALDRAGGLDQADGAARQRRPEHPARGIVRRADRHGHGRRGAARTPPASASRFSSAASTRRAPSTT